MQVVWNSINLSTIRYISQHPLRYMFLVRAEHEDILHGLWKVDVKGVISFYAWKGRVGAQNAVAAQCLWTCLCFCGAAARFTCVPLSPVFSYSCTDCGTTCILSFVTKDTSFLLLDPHRNPAWSGGSERLTWILGHSRRFWLVVTGAHFMAITHFTFSFPAWQLALRSLSSSTGKEDNSLIASG